MEQIARTDQGQRTQVAQITPDELIGYINSVTSGTKKGSFYNLPEEQMAALQDNITKMILTFRPFAALMTLNRGVTDDARIATALQLFGRPPSPDNGDVRSIRKWECAVLQDALRLMLPTRVFDLFHYLIGYRRVKEGKATIIKKVEKALGGRFVRGLASRWLTDNWGKLDFWSVKYQSDLRKLFRHLHFSPTEGWSGVKWLFGGEANTPMQRMVEKCRAADPGTVPNELWKLPYENARGFALDKFGMSKEEFEKAFSERGKKTVKEERISAKRTKAAGGESKFDPARSASLFDLYVYLGGQETLPRQAHTWLTKVAEREAGKIGLHLDSCAVIVDTSPSMFGTTQTPRHPLFRALAAARVFEKSSDQFGLYFTTEQRENPVIPKLHGATAYANSVLQALKDGYKTIVLIGDGYENSPEGMTHRLVHAYRMKVDTEGRTAFLHLNPVQAAESVGAVREMSPHVPAAGLSQTRGLPGALFISMAKSYPLRALEAYFAELLKLQSETTMALMPPQVQRLLPGTRT